MSRKQPTTDLDEIVPLLIKKWRRFHDLSGPPDRLQTREFRRVVGNVKELQEMGWRGNAISQDRHLLGAFLLYPWIMQYQEGLSLINELPAPPRRVLNICDAPAPFGFAALRHGAKEVVVAGPKMAPLELGAQVSGSYGYPMSIRSLNDWDSIEGLFDLIIVSYADPSLYSLNQIEIIREKLTSNGFLLFVDSSDEIGNHRILSIRDQLVEANYPIQAPCVWRGSCPARKSRNPCYAQREMEKPQLIRDIQRSASINLSSLKMSYLLVRHPESQWPTDQQDLYRIISPPVEIHRGKRFYLCGTDGKKSLESQISSHPKESKAFEYLRRGELISVKNTFRDKNTLVVTEKSSIKVVAASGKPFEPKPVDSQ